MGNNKNKTGEMTKAKQPNPKASEENKSNIPFDYDDYWLTYIKSTLESTLPNLKKKYTGYITFLDTLSTVTFIGGLAFSTYVKTTDPIVYFFIFFPIALLQYAKYKIKIDFNDATISSIQNLRSPIQINNAHNTFVKGLQTKLEEAKPWIKWPTILYIFLIPIGIFLHNYKNQPTTSELFFDKEVISIKMSNLKSKESLLLIKGKSKKTKKDTIVEKVIKTNANSNVDAHFHLNDLKMTPTKLTFLYSKDGKKEFLDFPVKKQASTIPQKQKTKTKETKKTDSVSVKKDTKPTK